jgi:hypothetical protein
MFGFFLLLYFKYNNALFALQAFGLLIIISFI